MVNTADIAAGLLRRVTQSHELSEYEYTYKLKSPLFGKNSNPKNERPFKSLDEIFKTQEKKMSVYKYASGDATKYGKRIAVDGEQWIMKSVDGSIDIINGKLAEEVLPFTVSVQFTPGEVSGKHYHYFAKEGEVAVGDLVFMNSAFAKVTGVNTKAKTATKSLDGWVIPAIALTVIQPDDVI